MFFHNPGHNTGNCPNYRCNHLNPLKCTAVNQAHNYTGHKSVQYSTARQLTIALSPVTFWHKLILFYPT